MAWERHRQKIYLNLKLMLVLSTDAIEMIHGGNCLVDSFEPHGSK